MALTNLFYSGNGTTQVDSGLPRVGVIHGVNANGDLLWYRYHGHGEPDCSGNSGWDPSSSNPIGNGFLGFSTLLGCGDGVILGIDQNGDLRWYKYDGNGEPDITGTLGFHPNSGNPIGNGFNGFLKVFVTPREGRFNSSRLTIYGIAQNGDLHWYSYDGNGESDITGVLGWHPNSGSVIGNGWQNFLHVYGSGGDIFAIQENGDLHWYSYHGNGESDPSGSLGWDPRSGNPIGNGFQNFRAVFGGANDTNGFHRVLFAVQQNGDLLWYRYDGHGEPDVSGFLGWSPNSGGCIGNGW
jgi:hypothetical protein